MQLCWVMVWPYIEIAFGGVKTFCKLCVLISVFLHLYVSKNDSWLFPSISMENLMFSCMLLGWFRNSSNRSLPLLVRELLFQVLHEPVGKNWRRRGAHWSAFKLFVFLILAYEICFLQAVLCELDGILLGLYFCWITSRYSSIGTLVDKETTPKPKLTSWSRRAVWFLNNKAGRVILSDSRLVLTEPLVWLRARSCSIVAWRGNRSIQDRLALRRLRPSGLYLWRWIIRPV